MTTGLRLNILVKIQHSIMRFHLIFYKINIALIFIGKPFSPKVRIIGNEMIKVGEWLFTRYSVNKFIMGGYMRYITYEALHYFKRFATIHFLKFKAIVGRSFNFTDFFRPLFFQILKILIHPDNIPTRHWFYGKNIAYPYPDTPLSLLTFGVLFRSP